MKIRFQYNDPISGQTSANLMMEISQHGMSVLTYQNDPFKIHTLEVYDFETTKMLDELSEFLAQRSSMISQAQRKKLYFNLSSFAAVPNEMLESGKEALWFPHLSNDSSSIIYHKDLIHEQSVTHLCCINAELDRLLFPYFEFNQRKHSHVALLNQLSDHPCMMVNIFYGQVKIILSQNRELLHLSDYQFVSHADVLYQILSIADRFEIPTNQLHLQLSGLITSDSILYSSLYGHFENITFHIFESCREQLARHEDLPVHFFTHLAILSTCES